MRKELTKAERNYTSSLLSTLVPTFQNK